MATGKIISFIALPSGWRNVFADAEGPIIKPCPGVLLFEDGDYPKFADVDGVYLVTADDSANYLRTLAPGEEL